MKELAIQPETLLQPLTRSFVGSKFTTLAKFLACCAVFSASSVVASPQKSAESNQPIPLDVENIPGTIVVREFEVIGNRVIPESEIDQLLQPYLFRPLSFVELLEVQQVLTELHVKRGYFTSGAYIPPQTIKGQKIKIEIIEGSIEEIKIYGLEDLRPEYIRSRLAIATKPPLHQEKLLDALKLLQLDPLIENISAELSQGVNPGESYLEVKVEEADAFFTELTVDNYRTPSVGSQSRQIAIGDHNLLGFGDRLDIAYINTDGSNSLENLSYAIPLGAKNNELSLFYSFSNSTIIIEPFRDLDLGSRNYYLGFSYRQPLYETPSQEIAIGFSFSHQDTQLSLMGVGFPTLARGSDVEGTTKISTLRLYQEYSDRNKSHVFAVRSQFSIGLDIFNATDNPDGVPDGKFVVWRGQAQYLKKLTDKTNLFLSSDLQFSDRALVSLEQFTSGGASGVRGYARDRVLGDNGIFLSAELKNTLWQTSEGNLTVELNPFFDFARVWNSDDLPIDNNTLASLGLSLQFWIKDYFITRLDWGLPLIEDDDLPGDSLQESGFYFSFKFKPF